MIDVALSTDVAHATEIIAGAQCTAEQRPQTAVQRLPLRVNVANREVSYLEFLPMSRCSGSLPSDYPLWGVLNSADSHRRSESIGTADADKSVYGPLQRVASHNISTFFAMPTTERTLDAELETAYGDGLILELDARLDLQLPE